MNELRVIYIVGMGRSGSTLLDRLLGEEPGVASMGEASNIWRNGVLEGRTCACGEAFEDCAFWTEVTRLAPSALSKAAATEVARIHDHHLYTRQMWRVLSGPTRRRLSAGVPQSYLATVGAVYRAVAAVSGATTFVDSSKHPVYGYLLTLVPGLRVDFVHLVRDPRAVAYSWSRSRIEPGTNPPSLMHQYSAWQSGVLYDLYNATGERVAATSEGSYTRIRYEDFVEAPEAVLHEILPYRADASGGAGRDPRNMEVASYHAMSGNPMRFSGSSAMVTVDDEWRARMAQHDRRLVDVLTLPMALRYKYAPTRRFSRAGWRS